MSTNKQVEQMLEFRRSAAEKQRRDEDETHRNTGRLSSSNSRLAALQEIARRSQGLVEDRRRKSSTGGGLEARGYSGRKRNRKMGDDSDDDDDLDSGVSPSLQPMNAPAAITLRGAVGLPLSPKPLSESALIIVDAQNTYTEGPLKLFKVDQAMRNIKALLGRAREASIPIYHIAHDAGKDSAYDVNGHSGAIVPMLKPLPEEGVIIKNYPNSFEKTNLHKSLQDLDVKNLVIVGFMTHCCINSTARAAFNLGYESVTVIADCTATRVLPDPTGKKDVVTASVQQRAALAAISDLHCNVIQTASLLED